MEKERERENIMWVTSGLFGDMFCVTILGVSGGRTWLAWRQHRLAIADVRFERVCEWICAVLSDGGQTHTHTHTHTRTHTHTQTQFQGALQVLNEVLI